MDTFANRYRDSDRLYHVLSKRKEEAVMLKERMIVNVGELLEKASLKLAESTGCIFTIWGETELPDCIRKELEEKIEN